MQANQRKPSTGFGRTSVVAAPLATVPYRRRQAVLYARRYWNDPNPQYANMDTLGAGGDCTNFTSQCLLAGGQPMDYRATGQTTEWWYRQLGNESLDGNNDDWWSCSWALPNNQFFYESTNQGQAVDLLANPALARRLRLGDIIYYDWHNEGTFTHSAIVTAFNRYHVPYVTYRTLIPRRPQRNVHWRLRFRGNAYRIWAVHINDQLQVFDTTPDFSTLVPCDQTKLTSQLE